MEEEEGLVLFGNEGKRCQEIVRTSTGDSEKISSAIGRGRQKGGARGVPRG